MSGIVVKKADPSTSARALAALLAVACVASVHPVAAADPATSATERRLLVLFVASPEGSSLVDMLALQAVYRDALGVPRARMVLPGDYLGVGEGKCVGEARLRLSSLDEDVAVEVRSALGEGRRWWVESASELDAAFVRDGPIDRQLGVNDTLIVHMLAGSVDLEGSWRIGGAGDRRRGLCKETWGVPVRELLQEHIPAVLGAREGREFGPSVVVISSGSVPASVAEDWVVGVDTSARPYAMSLLHPDVLGGGSLEMLRATGGHLLSEGVQGTSDLRRSLRAAWSPALAFADSSGVDTAGHYSSLLYAAAVLGAKENSQRADASPYVLLSGEEEGTVVSRLARLTEEHRGTIVRESGTPVDFAAQPFSARASSRWQEHHGTLHSERLVLAVYFEPRFREGGVESSRIPDRRRIGDLWRSLTRALDDDPRAAVSRKSSPDQADVRCQLVSEPGGRLAPHCVRARSGGPIQMDGGADVDELIAKLPLLAEQFLRSFLAPQMEVFTPGRIVILVDVTGSMIANDFGHLLRGSPSAARRFQMVDQLLRALEYQSGDPRIALATFSGPEDCKRPVELLESARGAWWRLSDAESKGVVLGRLAQAMGGRACGNTDLGPPLILSSSLLQDVEAGGGAVVLVTDGAPSSEDPALTPGLHSSARAKAEHLFARGIPVHALLVQARDRTPLLRAMYLDPERKRPNRRLLRAVNRISPLTDTPQALREFVAQVTGGDHDAEGRALLLQMTSGLTASGVGGTLVQARDASEAALAIESLAHRLGVRTPVDRVVCEEPRPVRGAQGTVLKASCDLQLSLGSTIHLAYTNPNELRVCTASVEVGGFFIERLRVRPSGAGFEITFPTRGEGLVDSTVHISLVPMAGECPQ